MLLRAYVIRLADGLVASRDQSSVVTDMSVASLSLFAAAKVAYSYELDWQVVNKLSMRNYLDGANVAVFG